MVDMEEKVIAQTLQSAKRSKQWRYPAKQQFCQKRGSGNNWAHGYCVHGPKVCDTLYLTVSFIVALACVECSTNYQTQRVFLSVEQAEEAVMAMIQREAEKCDRLGGFLGLLSLAGGTGSGVGAYVTQCVRDEFPQAFILNQVVAPYNMGEVIVSTSI